MQIYFFFCCLFMKKIQRNETEREAGTQQPKTFCDVEYYGLNSPQTGTVTHPEATRIKSQHNGNVKCKQHFIPAANQAVIITVSFLILFYFSEFFALLSRANYSNEREKKKFFFLLLSLRLGKNRF